MREPIKDKGRLLHMLDAINTILQYADGITYENLCANKVLFGGVVYHIVIIGEASHMLTQAFKEAHPETSWKQIKGMRNHIVHGYYTVDPEDVWYVLQHDLAPLREQVTRYLSETDWDAWEKAPQNENYS